MSWINGRHTTLITGRNCDIAASLCNSNPCLHNEACHGNINNYTCDCSYKWAGTNCELQVNIRVYNVYIYIMYIYASSNYSQPMEDRQSWVDTLEARGPPSSALISVLIMCPGTSTPKACPGVRSSIIGSKKMRLRCSMTANQQGCGLSSPDITIINS